MKSHRRAVPPSANTKGHNSRIERAASPATEYRLWPSRDPGPARFLLGEYRNLAARPCTHPDHNVIGNGIAEKMNRGIGEDEVRAARMETPVVEGITGLIC